jgi:hypothetical protein
MKRKNSATTKLGTPLQPDPLCGCAQCIDTWRQTRQIQREEIALKQTREVRVLGAVGGGH